MKSLTEKQRRIFDFLISFTKEHGYPPTVREIGEHFGFLWAAAKGHLKALERKGFIRINPSKSRGIEIFGLRHVEGLSVLVAGEIRAGRPILAIENFDSYILIDKTLFPAEDAFSLKVKGDSMIEAGILDGDYVIVRPQNTIKNGEIGVALIDNETTVKRIFIKNRKIILKPENKNIQPVSYKPEEISIIGKVIGVIRRI